ncbi:class I SAM-dependent methyltransferase [Candidatus Woesearchaeota archaeon]|nr:class I SAM-dependent methyltransferase [Candidatus Woesearchaeota archaeon]
MGKDDLKAWNTALKEAYHAYYQSLFKTGKLPLRSTQVGFWGPAVHDEIWDLFIGYLNLYQTKSFLDLGSGDGKVVLLASLFTKAHGIEYDEQLHHVAQHMANHFKLPATFIQGDYMHHNLSTYDLIFLHPDKHDLALEKKFLKELNGKLVVYGYEFHPQSLKKIRSFRIGGTPVAIYTRP